MNPDQAGDERTLRLTIKPVMDAVKDQNDPCKEVMLQKNIFAEQVTFLTVGASHDDEVPREIETGHRSTLHGQALRVSPFQLSLSLNGVEEGVFDVEFAVPGGFLAEVVEDAGGYVVQGKEPGRRRHGYGTYTQKNFNLVENDAVVEKEWRIKYILS